MLHIREAQLHTLKAASLADFAKRCDDALADVFGPLWTERGEGERTALIDRVIADGRRYALDSERTVFQYAVIKVLMGDEFLDEPDIRSILEAEDRSGLQKMYQVTSLAEADLAEVEPPIPLHIAI